MASLGDHGPARMKRVTILVLIALVCAWLNPGLLSQEVCGENQVPVAKGGNITVEEPGKMVFFSALGSYDPDGEIVLYEWDFQGDNIYDWNSTENGTTEYEYKDEGAYNATLRVTDNNGTSSTDFHYVLILKNEDEDESDLESIRTVLTLVGVLEIVVGIGMISIAFYLKHKLYDRL